MIWDLTRSTAGYCGSRSDRVTVKIEETRDFFGVYLKFNAVLYRLDDKIYSPIYKITRTNAFSILIYYTT